MASTAPPLPAAGVLMVLLAEPPIPEITAADNEAVTGLGPNAAVPCPSESCRRTALAHGRICPVCEPNAEWTSRCPECSRPVVAVGLVLQRHRLPVGGRRFYLCPGAGSAVVPPPVEVTPIWREGMPRQAVVRNPLGVRRAG